MASEYNRYRKGLLNFIKEELLGPTEPEEVIAESPLTRYSMGILYPQVEGRVSSASEELFETDNTNDANSDPDKSSDDEIIPGVEYSATFNPSALGLSFVVPISTNSLMIKVSGSTYVKPTPNDVLLVKQEVRSDPTELISNTYLKSKVKFEDNHLVLISPVDPSDKLNVSSLTTDPNLKWAFGLLYDKYISGYKRQYFEHDIEVELSRPFQRVSLDTPGLSLISTLKKYPQQELVLCTLSLVNDNSVKDDESPAQDDKSFYQCNINVTNEAEHFVSMSENGFTDNVSSDQEEESLRLLYKDNHSFSVGHGCSGDWHKNEEGAAYEVFTNYLPTYEIPNISFDQSYGKAMDLTMLSMWKEDISNVINNLNILTENYSAWIEELKDEMLHLADPRLRIQATKHIELCNESLVRMKQGVGLIHSDSHVQEAFRLANRAMLMQRVHGDYQRNAAQQSENRPYSSDYEAVIDSLTESKRPRWRMFQIAFILMSIGSITDPEDSNRDIVDLIWFPTGGGKTEAYLGLTAFTIFLRRLTNSEGEYGGTVVIMRYTLRLLATQQSQRASALICACDVIRSENIDRLGNEPITIGLWLGSAVTPNTLSGAKEALNEMFKYKGPNKFQVLACPWCGTYTYNTGKGSSRECYRVAGTGSGARFEIYCNNNACHYYESSLPIKVIDEDLYKNPPTLLFGTVDKFAQLPLKQDSARLFAADEGNSNLPPELIIQDELHLISGSLGTVVGLYESAIDELCSKKGIRPKIVASTATIRRASEQCKALFARDMRQFPAQGLDYKDSYFAKAVDVEKSPGRLYIGVMPSGKSPTTLNIRLASAATQGVMYLPAALPVKDSFYTLVTYCNSIRELGSVSSAAMDDMSEYSEIIARRVGLHPRRYIDRNIVELTSRKSAEQIPRTLQKLEVQLSDNKSDPAPVELLLATSMISVGVDIPRLGIMTIIGQPKTTAEYIQASSRVGRENPGLVITQYNPSKSRDRSHYEKFMEYHQSIYRWVEPTSITPFSEPARDRALHAVVLSLIRHYFGVEEATGLNEFLFDGDKVDELKEIINQRVKYVDHDEVEGSYLQVERILNELRDISSAGGKIVYTTREQKADEMVIMQQGDETTNADAFHTMISMRSTDSVSKVKVDFDEW